MQPTKSLSDQLPLDATTVLLPWLRRLLLILEPRIGQLELARVSDQEVIDLIRDTALDRVNTIITPLAVEATERLREFSKIFFTGSSTTVALAANTERTWYIDAGTRATFASLGYVAVNRRNDPLSGCMGKVTSYNSASGALTVAIRSVWGTVAAYNDWEITATLPIDYHVNRADNPHSTTAEQVGAYTKAAADTAIATAVANALATIRGGVDAAGDTMVELYALIQALNTALNSQGSAIVNRLRVDADQGLNAVQQAQARANAGGDAAYATRRNRFYDPGCRFSQEVQGAASNLTANQPYYATDSVYALRTPGMAMTAQQIAQVTPGGSPARVRVLSPSAQAPGANDAATLTSPIEGQDVADFQWGDVAGRTALIRFMVNASVAGKYPIAVRNSTYTRSWLGTYTISAAEINKDVIKWVRVPADTNLTPANWKKDNAAGMIVSWAVAAGSSFLGVEGWQAGSLLAPAGCVSPLATSGASFAISELGFYDATDLQSGVIPRWELPDLLTDYLKAQRYFASMLLSLRGPGTSNGGTYSATFSFPVIMRVSPAGGLSSAPSRANLNAVNMGINGPQSARLEIVAGTLGDSYVLNDLWFFYARM